MEHAISFDVSNKSAEITYLDLVETMEVGNSFGGLHKNVPMQPGVLVKTINDRMHELTGYQPIIKPIVIRETYCQVNRERLKRNESLQLNDYIVKRFVTKIEMPELISFEGTNDQMKAAVAISYAYTDQVKGIQVAFGENVSVCENLTAFGRYSFSSHGKGKIGFDEGMQLLTHWLQNINPIHEAHISTINELKEKQVNRQQMTEFIGELFESAVYANAGDIITAPLNQAQVAAMLNEGRPQIKAQGTISAWDIMNWGTAVLKPHNSDMVSIISDTTDYNDFVLEHFGIPFEPVLLGEAPTLK